jgi:hypothetical protein
VAVALGTAGQIFSMDASRVVVAPGLTAPSELSGGHVQDALDIMFRISYRDVTAGASLPD